LDRLCVRPERRIETAISDCADAVRDGVQRMPDTAGVKTFARSRGSNGRGGIGSNVAGFFDSLGRSFPGLVLKLCASCAKKTVFRFRRGY
jgi:hypothetical protein